jgi:DNA mismatch repair ATPase MutS
MVNTSLPYLIFSIGLIAIAILFFIGLAKARKKRVLQELRHNWGRPKDEDFDFNVIGRFARIESDNAYHKLSDQTINDIDFYKLFALLDRTTSRVGQQFLYRQVSQPTNSIGELQKFDESVNLFTKDVSLREQIQLDLVRLSSYDAHSISLLFRDKLIEKPTWYRYIWLNISFVVALILLATQFPALLILLIVPIILNMFLHYWNKNNTFQFVKSFPQLSLLMEVSKKMNLHDLLKKEMVDESLSALKPFQKKLRLISLGQDGSASNELSNFANYFTEIIKAIFLIELYALFSLTKELENKKEHIITLFTFVGQIDSAISVASLRSSNTVICKPIFTESTKQLFTKGMYHPLVKKCVTNDISIDQKGILITGSNMSGKATFLRTLTINSILAQSLYTCFAESFTTPILKQFSSIRIDDNLLDGKSYYFEEVNVIGSLISEVGNQKQNLFVLDEVFRGTNTVERIASAKAILSYLNKGENIVIVSTHDVELAEMLKEEYDLYHFSESVEGKELLFDHTLKDGPLKTRNAITILEIADYPKEIVEEARRLSC